MKIINYFKETYAEMKHVSWPTKKQALGYTILVVVISTLVAIYLGVFDLIFVEGVKMAL